MMTGPNLDATAEVMEISGRPVIASGGVGRLEDVVACKRIGCEGVILGRAWYEGRVDLARACQLAGA
jgi:phosphoribosylformimino-5-aminoimidazole carboxamide ribotide isomerase